MNALFRYPSGWIPLALSFAMFGVLMLAITGFIAQGPAGDEGTAAHLFQLWLVTEAVTIVFFAVRWFGSRPKDALSVSAVQILAVLALMTSVFFLHL